MTDAWTKAVRATENAYARAWATGEHMTGAALTAALSALEAEGWVMVPKNITTEMLLAQDFNSPERCKRVWSAMISARPSIVPDVEVKG
jgi:proline racemase